MAILNDIKELQRDWKRFDAAGIVEIVDLSHRLSIVDEGLRSLAALVLNVKVSKAAQMSNWENAELTEAQVQYAAMDAWVGLQLYLKLGEMLREEADVAPEEFAKTAAAAKEGEGPPAAPRRPSAKRPAPSSGSIPVESDSLQGWIDSYASTLPQELLDKCGPLQCDLCAVNSNSSESAR